MKTLRDENEGLVLEFFHPEAEAEDNMATLAPEDAKPPMDLFYEDVLNIYERAAR